jgi:hypothetical protein
MGVGYGNQRIVKGAYSGGTKSNHLNDPFGVADLYPVAYLERSIDENHQAAEKVGNGIFRGESNGNTPNAQTSHEGSNVDIQVLEEKERSNKDRKNLQSLADQGYNLII